MIITSRKAESLAGWLPLLVIWYGLRYDLAFFYCMRSCQQRQRVGSDHGVFFISGTYKHYGEEWFD